MATPGHKIEPRSHWSKDYVEHLRTVHFTLVAVCLTLVVLITSDRKSTVSSARAELRGIRDLVNNWNRNWATEEAARVLSADDTLPFAQLPPDAKKSELEVEGPDGKSTVVELRYEGPNWMMTAIDHSLRTATLSPHPPLGEPETLADFRWFWDMLSKDLHFEVPVELEDTPQVSHMGQPLKARFVSGKKPTIATPLHLMLSIRSTERGFYKENPNGFYGGEESFLTASGNPSEIIDSIALPVKRSEPASFDPYHQFVDKFGWRRGTFDQTFPNLNAVTKNYEQLDFDTVDKILEGEESRAGDSFEAIGIKFPAEGVTRWGILLILGIQMYFFLHLHELTPKLKASDEGWEVAWIGVYKSAFARMISFSSIILLPAAASFALAWHMPTLTRGAWWLRLVALVLGSGLSLILGLLAWRRLRKNST